MNEHIQRAIDIVGSGVALAEAIDRSPQFISQLLNGDRPVPAELCLAIDRVTNGVVACEQLRDDVDWGAIRNRPSALGRLAVAKTA